MEFFDVIEKRHSVRSFRSKEVEAEKLEKIIEAANKAPSAGNLQGYEIVVVREKETKQRLSKAALNQEFIAEAPIALVFCANPVRSSAKYGERGANLYCVQDATIAAAYAQLAATDLGLASVWVGAFATEEVSRTINATDVVPVAIMPIGYSNKTPYKTPRRSLDDLSHKEKF